MSNEHTQAANALIEWFNSQEISRKDSSAVMAKVLAKVMILKASDTATMRDSYETFVTLLANELNDRALFVVRKSRQ